MGVATPSEEQYLKGARRLAAAILDEPTTATTKHPLDEGLELAHISRERWHSILLQMEQCRRLTRRQLGLRSDGLDGWDDLAGQEQEFATGLRVFLRRLSILIADDRSIDTLAMELHSIVYAGDQLSADVTVRDYATVLQGRDDQPDVWAIRQVARLLRTGHPVDRVMKQTGLSRRQVMGVSRFLGRKNWAIESKQRAARIALSHGWTAAQLAEHYNERADGVDEMSVWSAKDYLAAARREASES